MRFIAFEGLDGSGKSTLMKGLKIELERLGRGLVMTREPGGTELGNAIRELLLRTTGEAPTPRAEALLYQADRAQHCEHVIRPALKRGDWVLSDRFAASSLAFQAKGRSLSSAQIEWLNGFSTQELQPDLYVLLDLPVSESLKRLQTRGQAADRFEQEHQEFHERVRAAYLSLAQAAPGRWLVLDSTRSSEELLKTLLERLQSWLV